MANPVSDILQGLLDEGRLPATEVEALRSRFRGEAGALVEALIARGTGTRQELSRRCADRLGVSWVDLTTTIFERDAIARLPEAFARKHQLIPLYHFGEKITVATSSPENFLVLEEASALAGVGMSPVFALPGDISDAIAVQYRSCKEMEDTSSMIDGLLLDGDHEITLEELKAKAGAESVVRFNRELILLALKERASDIHIQPAEGEVRVRFRIDGVLHDRLRFALDGLAPVVSCLKIMAGVDIMERRRPQDGRISFALVNRSIDLRFSSVPTVDGEKIVMRLLGQIDRRGVPDLEVLDLSRKIYDAVSKVITTPNGVFFVTGPTGSGKTTTLYSILKRLNSSGINILTVEDPVEYRLPGLGQVQVNHEIGLDFSSVLRSFLRQDPDVILVGEVRDMETARITSQAALTGHLVLSTMHTNNALQAVTRLVEIGVEPFLVAPSIIAVMAQRLVRRICTGCSVPEVLSAEETARLFRCEADETVTFFRGKGCERCNGTGYFGRLGIHEIFMIDDEVRHLIARESSILDIAACAQRSGFEPLEYDGMKKVLRGMTTLEEIERAAAAHR